MEWMSLIGKIVLVVLVMGVAFVLFAIAILLHLSWEVDKQLKRENQENIDKE